MVDNLMLDNFLARNKLYGWIFNIYKKTNFTYFFMIFGFVNDGNPDASSKNPIKQHWYWCEGIDSLDDLYDHVNQYQDEARRTNKQFVAITLEDDEAGNYRITLATKQLISLAAERDRYKIAKDGEPIHGVPIPEKFQMPLEGRASNE